MPAFSDTEVDAHARASYSGRIKLDRLPSHRKGGIGKLGFL